MSMCGFVTVVPKCHNIKVDIIKQHLSLWSSHMFCFGSCLCMCAFRFPVGSTVHTHGGIQAYLAPSHERSPVILLFDALQKINRLHTETWSTLTGCAWCQWTRNSKWNILLVKWQGRVSEERRPLLFELAFILDQNALFRFTHQQQGSLGACRHWC